jgi:hypothetical protein
MSSACPPPYTSGGGAPYGANATSTHQSVNKMEFFSSGFAIPRRIRLAAGGTSLYEMGDSSQL